MIGRENLKVLINFMKKGQRDKERENRKEERAMG